MSSIDKYVIQEAKRQNPNVQVVNSAGRIVGRINGQVVFNIADRYGYLSSSESLAIQSGIKAYELAQERERQRLEAERLERERRRKAAYNALVNNVQRAKNSFETAYESAKRAYEKTRPDFSDLLKKLDKYNVEAFKEKAQDINRKFDVSRQLIDERYQQRLQEINRISGSLNSEMSQTSIDQKSSELNRININFNDIQFPREAVNTLSQELTQIQTVFTEIEGLENNLLKYENDGIMGAIITKAVAEIHNQKITSLADVNGLLGQVQAAVSEAKNAAFSAKIDKSNERIAVLDAVSASCIHIREIVNSSTYKENDFSIEIAQEANAVNEIYSDLFNAEYSTCSKEDSESVCNEIQEILMSGASDEKTLLHLRSLRESGKSYKNADRALETEYADYQSKRDELIAAGVDESDIEAFDLKNYSAQCKRLNKELLKQDIENAKSGARISFLTANEIMEQNGYKLLYTQMTGEGESGSLACQGVYARPGCPGVVWQVITTNESVHRSIIGIQRADGSATLTDRVKEVAEIEERENSVVNFLQEYNKYNSIQGFVETVDVATPNSTETIEKNGCFKLTKEGEEVYDSIIAAGSTEEKNKWRTRMTSCESKESNLVNKITVARERACEASHAAMRAKRP